MTGLAQAPEGCFGVAVGRLGKADSDLRSTFSFWVGFVVGFNELSLPRLGKGSGESCRDCIWAAVNGILLFCG